MSAPAVSVVMPVHNAALFLRQSVESILTQTFKDFELVVLENGSSDESRSILQRYAAADPRVRLIEHPRPLGLVRSSNHVVSESRAPLVARMDADDVSHPTRLERQLEVMRRRDDVVAVGTLVDGIDSEGRRVRPRDRWRLIRCPEMPFPHGSAMVRRGALESVGGYREGTPLTRDVELFLRLADQGRIVVLPDALYSYRYHLTTTGVTSPVRELARSMEALRRSLVERRAGRDHVAALERSASEPLRPDSLAAATYYQGVIRLWAGHSPGILGQLVREGGLRPSPVRLRILAWAAWGKVSPSTLRFFLRTLVRARDAAAGTRIDDGTPCEWRPEATA